MRALPFVAAACVLWSLPAAADRLYAHGFETPVAPTQFPLVDGSYRIPPGPAADQLAWVLSELASGETTTPDEAAAHFVAEYDPAAMAAFLQTLRGHYPDAVVTDVVGVTPVDLTVVIGAPGVPPYGFVRLHARYTGNRAISLFGVTGFSGSVMYPEDATLTLTEAVAKFGTLSAAPALLVGRIDRASGQCSQLAAIEADALRATGSVFKTWLLGGVAVEVARGALATDDPVPLQAAFLAPGGAINGEPPGTPFPLSDMAALMMGISDNTATDHLLAHAGRDAADAFVDASGVADASVLKPLLGISEQFHLFFSFPLATSLAYVDGSEAFQRQFLDEQIAPLGPFAGGSFNNESLFTTGSWRASPFDVCAAFARLRRMPHGSDALWLVDHALGAQAAQPDVRNRWDRVWYKGGSLVSGANGHLVLTHAWMLEDTGEDPYVVVAMANDDGGDIDVYAVQSVTGRILERVSALR